MKTVSVIGLGYVGYPLACLFSNKGFNVIGYDTDNKKIKDINQGKNLPDEYAPNFDVFKATNDSMDIKNADAYIITVPTPLGENNLPDLSYIESACETIKEHLSKGNLVVLESTTYPGTTEEIVKPILEKTGLKAGADFYLCFSPERIDPGNKKWRLEDIPKIIGGINNESKDVACSLYSKVFDNIIPVSSTRVAEATKILENIFRNVNIALVSEVAKIFEKLRIDTWEVIDAASTKPYAFMSHYPGPGVGGHCLPVDPFYLAYRAKKEGVDTRFIELAGHVNRSMPYHVILLAKEALDRKNKMLRDCKLSVLGVTYKKNIPDIRETPAKAVITELLKETRNVSVFDPENSETFGATSETLEEALTDKDCIILLVDHDYFSEQELEQMISKHSPDSCVIDTRNFLDRTKLDKNVFYKCLGK